MTTFSDEESDLLDRIAIDVELDRLTQDNRALIELRVAYDIPADYAGPWPPQYADTGKYVGHRYMGKPLSSTCVHARTKTILVMWRRRYHPPARSSSPKPLSRAA